MRRRWFIVFSVFSMYFPFAKAKNRVFEPLSKNDFQRLQETAKSLAVNLEFARHIGRIYIEQSGNQSDLYILARRLGLKRGRVSDIRKTVLQDRVRMEFQRGETLTIGGWIVARSEAYLYAMLALQT